MSPRFLISVFVRADNTLGSQEDNADVKPERPVLDIPDITLDTLLHLPELLRLTTETRYLSPTGNSRFREVANHILINQTAINLSVIQHVRSRTHDTHVALQYINKLRELINIRLSHEVAERKLSWVILRRLSLVRILVHMHRTELQTHECITIQTRSSLTEEDRTRTLNLDNQRNDWNERQENRDRLHHSRRYRKHA